MVSAATSKETEDTLFVLCYVFKMWYQSTINLKDALVLKTSGQGHAPINGKGALVMKTSDQGQTPINGKGALVTKTSDRGHRPVNVKDALFEKINYCFLIIFYRSVGDVEVPLVLCRGDEGEGGEGEGEGLACPAMQSRTTNRALPSTGYFWVFRLRDKRLSHLWNFRTFPFSSRSLI